MRRLLIWTGIVIVIGLLGAGLGAYLVVNRPVEDTLFSKPIPGRKADGRIRLERRSDKQESRVYLYFGNAENTCLKPEEQRLRHSGEADSLGRRIVEALIRGPETGLVRTIPERTVLNGFYLTDDGIAYIDLSEAVSEDHPGGVVTEYLTVFSIVNSLVLNIPEITRVKILINGREAATLAGHIDLGAAYSADMVMIR